MKDLKVRLDAPGPDAGAAIRVIGYFGRLTEAGAGPEAIVRGAAGFTRPSCRAVSAATSRVLKIRPRPARPGGVPVSLRGSWPPDRGSRRHGARFALIAGTLA